MKMKKVLFAALLVAALPVTADEAMRPATLLFKATGNEMNVAYTGGPAIFYRKCLK